MGCGGATETDLLGDPATVGSDAGKDASTGPDGTAGKDGGIGDSSVNDGPTLVDAPFFDVTPIPVDSGPTDPGTLCFTQYNPPISTYCKPGTELCCIKQSASACVPNQVGSCNQPATRMSCDDSADCAPGNVCCGSIFQFNQQPYYSEIKCAATCAVNNQTPGYRRFCDPNAPVDECAAIGLQCNASTVLPGYYACGN